PDEKVSPISIYGCRIIKVAGDYGHLYYNSLEAGRNSGIYFANSDVPMRVEGSKTIAFEVFLQLGERVPDFVVVSTSSGGNLRGIEKGFRELRDSGLSASIPRLIVAQAKGCCPIDLAFSSRASEITRFDYPKTIAHAIENPYPPSGNAVLRILKQNDGMTVAIDEANILKAQRSLANNGLFVQPASAVAYAALSKLRSEMDLRKAIVVAVLTGSGLKYPAILKEHSSYVESTALASLEEVLKKRPTLH
ncbi:MAG: pyridoxal-phosphate dependent enzyme, partial [Kosmotogaceae bacterium]